MMNDQQASTDKNQQSLQSYSISEQSSNDPNSLQPTSSLQSTQPSQEVLGAHSVLISPNSAQISLDASPTGTPDISSPAPLYTGGFSVSPWIMIVLVAVVVIGAISFVWSQRNDIHRM